MTCAANLAELAVKMKNVGRAGTFVKVIDILRDDVDIIFRFEFCQFYMCLVGLHFIKLFATLVVEIYHHWTIPVQCVMRAYLFNFVIAP